LDPIPPNKRSTTSFSKVEMPYATKLFSQEMATFMNMSMRLLTTRDTMRLTGLETVADVAEVDAVAANQELRPIVYPSHHVPELVKQVALPTAGDIQKTLAALNDEARSAYQAEVATVLPATPAAGNLTVPPPGGNGAQEVELARNSFGPSPVFSPVQPVQAQTIIPVAQAINGEGVIATAEDGAPIINIDTSQQALQAEGLTVPADATRSLQPPMIPGQMGPQMGGWGGGQQIRRQRRSPSQPRWNQHPQGPPQMWNQPPPQQQMGGYEDQGEESQQKQTGPVKVIKMG
jgi:hypothetical protein